MTKVPHPFQVADGAKYKRTAREPPPSTRDYIKVKTLAVKT